MKLAVTSDLHLGITEEDTLKALAERIAGQEPDLLVLAGDLGEGESAFRRCLKIFSEIAPAQAVIPGNHDLWARTGSSRSLWETILPGHARQLGYVWLDTESVRVDPVAVAGSVAWYDYSAGDPAYPCSREEYVRLKRELNNDAWMIHWEWDDPGFAAEVGRGLMERLRLLQEDPAVQSIGVVTHVPVLEEQVFRRSGDRLWGISNAYYGNLTLGQEIARFPKVELLVSGHTHRGRTGVRERSGLMPLHWEVIGSEYGRPRYTIAELGRPSLSERPAKDIDSGAGLH